MRDAYLILSIDPGTTTAAVLLNYETGQWKAIEKRGLTLRDIIRASLEEGIIIALATDKAKPPGLLRKARAWLGVPLITPRADMTLEEKRQLTRDDHVSSQHVLDALAAARHAQAYLKQHEAAERKRYAHHGASFTPTGFFKQPSPPPPEREAPLLPSPQPVRSSSSEIVTELHERIRFLEERVTHLKAERDRERARAAYYARLARSLLHQQARHESLDVSLLHQVKRIIGVTLPSGVHLGRRGEKVYLRDLGIILHLPQEARKEETRAGRRRMKRAVHALPSAKRREERTSHQPSSYTPPPPLRSSHTRSERDAVDHHEEHHERTSSERGADAYERLIKLIEAYRQERREAYTREEQQDA